MARRRRGQKVDGWVILDKPLGLTSTQAVGKVRRLFDAQKAGHAGTLDPAATGVLPIALGEATKTIPFIMDARKSYGFEARFGAETDTLDLEGQTVRQGGGMPSREALEAALPAFVGDTEQMPPRYSALKVGGKRAYDLARAGEEVVLSPRRIQILSLEMTDYRLSDGAACFEVACGKGTYIRSLARDIAYKTDTYATVSRLRRRRVGPFVEAGAISFEKLDALSHSARAAEGLQPVIAALDDIPAFAVSDADAARIKQGQAIPLAALTSVSGISPATASSALVVLMKAGALIALARIGTDTVRPERVFNLT